MTIWKYILSDHVGKEVYNIPRGYQPLTVQVQNGQPCLWVMVNPLAPKVRVTVETVGTGHNITDHSRYVGSYQLDGGDFVGHVFIVEK